jgi:hypothetical protein
MAPLMAMIMPVVVSPIVMLDTSMATIGVSIDMGLSVMVFRFSVVCPWNVGVISSDGLAVVVSFVVVWYGW